MSRGLGGAWVNGKFIPYQSWSDWRSFNDGDDDGMIHLEANGHIILSKKRGEIAKALGLDDWDELAGEILAKSINASVKKIKRQMEENLKKQYALTNNQLLRETNEGGLKKRTKKSKYDTEILLVSKGPMRDITDFTISPSEPQSGAGKQSPVSAMVKRVGGMKKLERNGISAFLTRFASGHVAVVQRRPGEKYTRGMEQRKRKEKEYRAKTGIKFPWDMTRIKKINSPALPHLFGQKEVLDGVGDTLKRVMDEEITKRISKELERRKR